MMNGFSAMSVISLIGLVQGILLIIALRRIPERNRVANQVLSVFVGLVVLALLGRLFRHEGNVILVHYPQLVLLIDGPVYAYGPLLYLYLYSLTHPAAKLQRWWWVHFVPVALHLLHQLEYWFEPPAAFAQRLQTGNFPYASFILMGAVIQMGLYIAASMHLVYVQRPVDENSTDKRPIKRYVKVVLSLVVLGWSAWGYYALTVFTSLVPDVGYIVADIAWVTMSLLPMVLAYFAMGRQEVFKLIPIPRKYESSRLSEPDLAELQQQLSELMATEKPHLQPDLALADLADRLGCSTKALSRVINECFELNFFDFVNSYRIEEFKRLVQEERYQNQTVLAMAYDAGFNSKTAFYAAFKKFMPFTPSEYIKSVEATAQ